MPKPRLIEFSQLFLRIGNTTVGGGEVTVASLQRELIRREWLSTEQFGLAFALARITPGTNMLAFCAAAGWLGLGVFGALAAVLTVTIPSSLMVVWLTQICEAGDRVAWLGAVVGATIAAAVGITVASALQLARSQIAKSGWLIPAAIVAGAFGLRAWGASPLWVLAAGAIAGTLWRQP